MKVVFDEQIFLSQRRGGISAYFTHLITEFEHEPGLGVEPIGFPIRSTNEYLRAAGLAKPFAPHLMPQRRKAYIAVNAARRAARRRPAADVAHPTFYFSAPPRSRFVTTIHDMTPELFPELIAGPNPHFRKAEHVRAASAIACVSTTTADDLRRLHPGVTAPITITPLAVSPLFRPRPPSGGRPYVLFVGTRTHRYKHFGAFLKAMEDVVARWDVDVVVAGGGALTPEDEGLIAASGLSGRVRHVLPTDAELAALYSAAELFVFPSAYEGFGLPILEAMACRCPVVASDAPALIEVAEGAALHIPAGDVGAMATAVERVLDDRALADGLRARGEARAARASWAHTARATLECYRSALE